METPMKDASAEGALAAEGSLIVSPTKGSTKKRPPHHLSPVRRVLKKTPSEIAAFPGREQKQEETYLAVLVANHILRISKSFVRAKRLITWYRGQVREGVAQLDGRKISSEDVDVAEQRVREVWQARLARARRPSIGNVQLVMKRTAESCRDIQGAEEFIDGLEPDVGRVSTTGRVILEGELGEARGRCQQLFERLTAPGQSQETLRARPKRRDSALSDLSSSESEGGGKAGGAGGENDAGARNNLRRKSSDSKGSVERKATGTDEDDSDSDDLSSEEDVDSDGEPTPGGDDFIEPAQLVRSEGNYAGDWSGAPAVGSPGFNAFAAEVMVKASVASKPLQGKLDLSAACPPLQPHQEAATFLLHPASPISRLLIDHPTGSGKTREMIEVLNSFFQDPRPKVPIFPKEAVCRNFYLELLRWPSRYRDYFCCLRPGSASCAAGVRDWRSRRGHLWNLSCFSEADLRGLCLDIREVLEMKGCFYMGRMRRTWVEGFQQKFPTEQLPAAPLRALRYTSAGGCHSKLGEDGLPVSALFKIAFDRGEANVYSNKVVIMDEVHNLVRAESAYEEQLRNLRQLLTSAKGTVLAGFTGTPILCEPSEGRQLLDIIKGSASPEGDEGFISSFPIRPQPLFPQSLPAGIPDAVLSPNLRRQVVRKVPLLGEALQRYDEKRALGFHEKRLRRYCSLCVHFGSLHQGKSGSKTRVLNDFQVCAPKLHAIAHDVADQASKALVLVERHSGMEALLEYLRGLAARSDSPFGVATMEELSEFNSGSNLRGEKYRVLVADASQCSEGVSFFAVRRVLIADIPASPSALVQIVGRSIRMYGHAGLSQEEQTVSTTIYAASFPRWLRSSLGAWAYRCQRKKAKVSSSGRGSVDPEGEAEDAAGGRGTARPQEGVDTVMAEKRAKRLIRSLRRAGITTLEGLKERLDRFVEKRTASGVETAFVDEAGPMKEAMPGDEKPGSQDDELRRSSEEVGEGIAEGVAQDVAQDVAEGNVESKLQLEGEAEQDALPPGDGQPLKAEEAVAFLESIGLWHQAASLREGQQPKKKEGQPPKKKAKAGQPETDAAAKPSKTNGARPMHYLVRALETLRVPASAEEAAEKFYLSALTADEEALLALSAHSRKSVPALMEFRGKATDREVLAKLVKKEAEADEAIESGEDSAYEFGVSSGSEEEKVAPASGTTALVLPPGWRVERVKRLRGVMRTFVDPRGRVYRSEAQAKHAVAAERRLANMAQHFHSKYTARLAELRPAQLAAAAAAGVAAEGPGPANEAVSAIPGDGGMAVSLPSA